MANTTTYDAEVPTALNVVFYVFCTIKAFAFLLGLYGNVCLINIYRKKDLKIRFNALMLLLACCANTCLTLHLICWICSFISGASKLKWALYFISEFPFRGIIYSTVAVTIERYLVLCKRV